MSRLLMVGCGWMGRPYLERAHRRGLDVIVLDSKAVLAWDETGSALGPGDVRHLVPADDDAGWLEGASLALRDGPVAGVLGFSEPHILAAALLADELKLPGPGLRAATTSRNKFLQRRLFARAGLAQPEHQVAWDEDVAVAWAAGGYPVVAKPLSSSGSLGVRIVANEGELRTWCRERAAPGPFLVEQCLTGPEYSAEAITQEGSVVFWSITEKVTTPPPYCVELEHWVPAELEPGTRAQVGALLTRVVDALGMGSGIVHLEFRLEPSGPHIMEVAVRTPGDYIMDVVQAATGVDVYDAAIAVACGRPPMVDAASQGAACVWYPVVSPGVVTAIEGAERVRELDGVLNVEVDVAVGATVKDLRSSMDRVGTVLLQARNRAELEDRLKTVKDELRITVDPVASPAPAV